MWRDEESCVQDFEASRSAKLVTVPGPSTRDWTILRYQVYCYLTNSLFRVPLASNDNTFPTLSTFCFRTQGSALGRQGLGL